MILLPGFTTHYLFGVKAYNDLPNNYLKHVISKYRWLYQLGLQGPDIFFYNIPILRHRDYRNVGSHMHEYHVNRFFQNYLKRLAEIKPKQQREQAISYLAGFLCHYAADSICPPLCLRPDPIPDRRKSVPVSTVFTRSWKTTSTPCFFGSSKRKSRRNLTSPATICLNGQEMQFISHLLSLCINDTYYQISERNNFQVTDGMVFRSIYAIRFGGRILSDPEGRKQSFLNVMETMFLRNHIASKKVVTDAAPTQVRKTLNLDHEVWTNPWNKSLASRASFLDLYHQTLQKCSMVYFHLNTLLTCEDSEKEAAAGRFLAELGNYSYHSGLDAGA